MSGLLPPVVKRYRKEGNCDKEKFFRELSEECGFVNPEVVERFYYGLVRKLTRDIRNHDVGFLPHIGYFYFFERKIRRFIPGAQRGTAVWGEGKVFRFRPVQSWRNYFSKVHANRENEGF